MKCSLNRSSLEETNSTPFLPCIAQSLNRSPFMIVWTKTRLLLLTSNCPLSNGVIVMIVGLRLTGLKEPPQPLPKGAKHGKTLIL